MIAKGPSPKHWGSIYNISSLFLSLFFKAEKSSNWKESPLHTQIYLQVDWTFVRLIL